MEEEICQTDSLKLHSLRCGDCHCVFKVFFLSPYLFIESKRVKHTQKPLLDFQKDPTSNQLLRLWRQQEMGQICDRLSLSSFWASPVIQWQRYQLESNGKSQTMLSEVWPFPLCPPIEPKKEPEPYDLWYKLNARSNTGWLIFVSFLNFLDGRNVICFWMLLGRRAHHRLLLIFFSQNVFFF